MTVGSQDVLIPGTGPAGIQAAIHAARKKVTVLCLGRLHRSSAYGAHIENYFSISSATGDALLAEGREQAYQSGAHFLEEDVMEVSQEGGLFLARTETGKRFSGKALVLAMGISRKKLKVPGEREFLGRGVSYCVDCDANFFKGQSVAVAGCESAAVSGALTLLLYATEVHLICEKLEVSDSLLSRLQQTTVWLYQGRRVAAIEGKTGVERVLLDDGRRLDVTGIFIELGAKGAVELAGPLGVSLDTESMQYVMTNRKQETNVPGLYAAGDICGPPWQVAKAVGEGCVAGLEAAARAKGRK